MNRLIGALTVGAIALSAFAQDFDRSVASIILLQTPAVQKELKLSEAQRNKMNTHANNFNTWQKSYQEKLKKAQGQPDMSVVNGKMTSLKTNVLKELSAVQVKRLREISLQAVGVAALGDDMVAKRVGLSSDQKTKIRSAINAGLQQAQKIQADADAKARQGIKTPKTEAEGKKAQETYSKNLQKLAPAAQKQLEQVRNSTEAKVMAMLSSSQKTTWAALQGKKFNP